MAHAIKPVEKMVNKIIKSPIIVIIGPTGVGKSRLSLELAHKYNSEIINADSMQIYKGFDIATNKVPKTLRKSIEHHVFDIMDPFKDIFTVSDYKYKAHCAINYLIDKNKIPIIVGGTNYYIESVLWDYLIKSQPPLKNVDNSKYKNIINQLCKKYDINDFPLESVDPFNILCNKPIYKLPTNELYGILKMFDPMKASLIHPNERRKIIRNIKIYEESGVMASDYILKQKNNETNKLSGNLLFSNCIMLWLDCDYPVLHKRISERVNQMIHDGLINELKSLNKLIMDDNVAQNLFAHNKGIFQNLGYKEFQMYLNTQTDNHLEEGKKLLVQKTLKYAKKQDRWIKSRFLQRRSQEETPPIYKLDTTNINNDSDWNRLIQEATQIIESHLKEGPDLNICCPLQDPKVLQLNQELYNKIYECQICQKFMSGEKSWNAHILSKSHKWKAKKINAL